MKRTRKNSKKVKKKTKTLRCSPKLDKKDYTCYTDKSLYKLKKFWNVRHPDSPIKSNNSKEIWSQLKTYMGSMCGNEACWLRQKFIVNHQDINYKYASKLRSRHLMGSEIGESVLRITPNECQPCLPDGTDPSINLFTYLWMILSNKIYKNQAYYIFIEKELINSRKKKLN